MNRSPRLLLASASPRRLAMLEGAGVAVEVRAAHLDEAPHTGESPGPHALRVALEKAVSVARSRSPEDPPFVLASDTVVTLDGQILGKPLDALEAVATLRRLSGRLHHVLTAFALLDRRGLILAHELTKTAVQFRPLTGEEIEAYVATGEPLDKAGAYGIQGGAGRFVESVDGPYESVVGLPLAAVLAALHRFGVVGPPADPFALRLALVRGRIAAAASAVNRSVADVTLVAVSKRHDAASLRAALGAGQRDFGENYTQELAVKALALASETWPPRWHFVGHLQSRKARELPAGLALVHALDSDSAAAALEREAQRRGLSHFDVLVQVNLTPDPQRSGLRAEDVPAFLESVKRFERVRVSGLMTLPAEGPLFASRATFARLATLRDACATPTRPLHALSMGMSGDFDQAIAEGATIVRIGTTLFGERVLGSPP